MARYYLCRGVEGSLVGRHDQSDGARAFACQGLRTQEELDVLRADRAGIVLDGIDEAALEALRASVSLDMVERYKPIEQLLEQDPGYDKAIRNGELIQLTEAFPAYSFAQAAKLAPSAKPSRPKPAAGARGKDKIRTPGDRDPAPRTMVPAPADKPATDTEARS